MYFVQFTILCVYLICFYWRCVYLCFHFMFSVLSDMFWTCYTSILMSTFKDLSWFFIIFLALYIAFRVSYPSLFRVPRLMWNGARRVGGRDRDFESWAIQLQLSLLDPSLDQLVEDPDVGRFSNSRHAFRLRRCLGVLEGRDLNMGLFAKLPQYLLLTDVILAVKSRCSWSQSNWACCSFMPASIWKI